MRSSLPRLGDRDAHRRIPNFLYSDALGSEERIPVGRHQRVGVAALAREDGQRGHERVRRVHQGDERLGVPSAIQHLFTDMT